MLGLKGLKSSLPNPLWDNKERECRRKQKHMLVAEAIPPSLDICISVYGPMGS